MASASSSVDDGQRHRGGGTQTPGQLTKSRECEREEEIHTGQERVREEEEEEEMDLDV